MCEETEQEQVQDIFSTVTQFKQDNKVHWIYLVKNFKDKIEETPVDKGKQLMSSYFRQ